MQYSQIKTIGIFFFLTAFLGCNDTESKPEHTTTKKWFKGNLHTHSYWSDGDDFPEVILDWYKSRGYQFAALSDHNTVAEGEKWVTVSKDSLYQNAFQSYLQKYGSEWVEYKQDSASTKVKLKTFEEYQHRVQQPEAFLVIKSEEITDRFEDKHIHMNATNIQSRIDPMGGTSVYDVMQNNLDQVLAQRDSTGVPIMPHINHPNFHYSIGLDDMQALNGERFFEVYNGHPMVHNMGDSVHISTEDMWDLINISYIENNKPLMFGLATDDSHHYHRKGRKWSNAGRGWVNVRADSLSASDLIRAMEAGDFYASTGVSLKKLEYDTSTLKIEVEAEAGVSYEIVFIGCKKGQTETEELAKHMSPKAEFKLSPEHLFVRAKIVSSKLQDNAIENILYEMAWTQPVRPNE